MTFNFLDASRCLSFPNYQADAVCFSAPKCASRTHKHSNTHSFLVWAGVWLGNMSEGHDVRHMPPCTNIAAKMRANNYVFVTVSERQWASVCVMRWLVEPHFRTSFARLLRSRLLVSSKPHSSVSQRQSNSVLTPRLHARLQSGQSI